MPEPHAPAPREAFQRYTWAQLEGATPGSYTLAGLLARNQAARRNYHVFWMMAPVFILPMWFAIERLQRWWEGLGYPAFIAMAVVFALMVNKPALWGG